MMDLVCRRYPNRRPSDYLEIDNPSLALQTDYALALKFHSEELDYDFKKTEATHSILQSIGTAGFGMKWESKPTTKTPKVVEDGIPLEQALAMFGGKGTVLKNHASK